MLFSIRAETPYTVHSFILPLVSILHAAEKREVCDHKLCDFDNVSFSVTISPDDTETINVGMNAPFWHEISDKGAQDGVEEFYHKYISSGDNNVNLAVPAADFKDGAGAILGALNWFGLGFLDSRSWKVSYLRECLWQ